VGLFGNKEEKAAKEEAGAAEVARLEGLSAAQLATELLSGLGPDGAKTKGDHGSGPLQLLQWQLRAHPYHPDLKRLLDMELSALERMAAAGLLTRRGSGIGTGAQTFKLSPLGEETLADGSIEQRLAGS
jgi:hypothetical protein